MMVIFIVLFALIAASGSLATEYAVKGPESEARVVFTALRDRLRDLLVGLAAVIVGLWVGIWILGRILSWLT